MDKTYNPAEIEQRWYAQWESQGWFAPRASADSAGASAYCIVIPPPNVTGTLHMGHAFQDTIMDALTRYHRMRGESTLWQPGTDHAGIATQMVVERQLNAAGIKRTDLTREDFVARVWQWKEQSGGMIARQMRRLGASVDWSRDRFTMDEGLSRAVTEVFVRLHDEGLIYRGKRLVNWDPVLQTALSDLEVLSEEETGSLWHLRYPLSDGSGSLIVATTRPETMLGDTAVAVHPEDERYAHLIGRKLRLPLTDREIPIIADTYVDPAFGSGCVKITPAHDFNDYAIGQRHNLPLINIFTPDARLNEAVPAAYRGLDRFEARKRVVADLEAAGAAREDRTAHAQGAARRSHQRGARALPHRSVVRDASSRWPNRRSLPSRAAASASCPRTGTRPTTSGCATSRTGASAASCGGVIAFPRGTTTPGISTWRTMPRPRRRWHISSTAAPCHCARTKTCSTPGSPPRCGRSRPWAGRRPRPSSSATTPPACWSPASTSSSSGSRA